MGTTKDYCRYIKAPITRHYYKGERGFRVLGFGDFRGLGLQGFKGFGVLGVG